jgi:hypothetical protein
MLFISVHSIASVRTGIVTLYCDSCVVGLLAVA